MRHRNYIRVLGRHRRRLLSVALAAALFGQLVSYALPARYQAVATIQVVSENSDPQAVIEMVRGRDLADFIVVDLALDRAPALRDGVQGAVWSAISDAWVLARYGFIAQSDDHNAAIDRASRALDATAISGRFVKITATSGSATLASQLANSAARGVASLSAKVARAAAAEQVGYLQTQTDDAKRGSDVARRQVLDYATRSGAIQSASVLAAAAELDRARTALRQNEIELIDARQRLAEVEADLRTTPQQTLTTTSDSSSRSTTSSLSPVYVTLRDRASARRQDVAALEARASTLEADVHSREANFRALLAYDSELSSMNRDLTLADQLYTGLERDLAVARSQAARTGAGIREIDHAVPPGYPAFPVHVEFAIASAAVAVLVTVLLLFIRHSTDTALRSPADAEAALADLRLLAVLPRSGATSRAVAKR